jgi:hypothetical protein
MDIAALSMNMAQGKVQDAAAMKVAKMGLNNMETQSEGLAMLMQSAAQITSGSRLQVISDPNVGQKINLVA